jgi:mannose-6-phosphate isomerase-like protein (cupin superfamily)
MTMTSISMNELPGGVGLSHLSVYPGSGSPHMHLACSESYVVIEGTGAVQTLTLHGYRETVLRPGAVVWFTPGTIHRLINHGALRLVVLMQNSGLPEAGDAVLTFPAEIVADPAAYAAAAALPPGSPPDCLLHGAFPGPASPDPAGSDLADTGHTSPLGGPGAGAEPAPRPAAALASANELATREYLSPAYARRELAISGFERLRDAAVNGDLDPLREFHQAAIALVGGKIGDWRDRWRKGALNAALMTESHLDSLAAGHAPQLSDADVFELAEPSERRKRGMCGLLNTYLVDR